MTRGVKRSVVLRLLELVGRPVLKTELVKLLYLVDRELARRGHGPLFEWRLWLYGPFSREAVDLLDLLEGWGHVEVRRETDEHLRVKSWYRATVRPAPLPWHLEETVSSVVDQWRNKRLDELLDYVYSLPEVREARLGEKVWPSS